MRYHNSQIWIKWQNIYNLECFYVCFEEFRTNLMKISVVKCYHVFILTFPKNFIKIYITITECARRATENRNLSNKAISNYVFVGMEKTFVIRKLQFILFSSCEWFNEWPNATSIFHPGVFLAFRKTNRNEDDCHSSSNTEFWYLHE